MQTLLPALCRSLELLPQLARKSDCYITPHPNYMPTGTRQPCIGIKDGGASRSELSCGGIELTARVELVCMVSMAGTGEAPMCADTGVFCLADAATTLLLNDWLDLPGCQGMEIGSDRPTELYQADNGQFLIKLVRTLIYTLHR